MSEQYPNPAYQSEVDAAEAGDTLDYDASTVSVISTPEASSNQVDHRDNLASSEVSVGLRKIAAMIMLGGGLASLGTAGWLTHEAHEATVHSETTITSMQQEGNYEMPQYDGGSAKAHELINTRNILVPLGASALGFALMQGSIAARKDRSEV